MTVLDVIDAELERIHMFVEYAAIKSEDVPGFIIEAHYKLVTLLQEIARREEFPDA